MGDQGSSAFTITANSSPNYYSLGEDSCALGIITSSSSIAYFTSDTRNAIITTTDGNVVGLNTLTFTWAPRYFTASDAGDQTATVDVTITPACAYSPIYFNTFFNPITVQLEATYPYTIGANEIYHYFQTTWHNAGYPNACTVGLLVSGEIAEFAEVDGLTVSVSPTIDTLIGLYEL